MRRNFLFLQGPCTPFFGHLADTLTSEGHAVHRINFCAGDALYWGQRPAQNFRGRVKALPDYFDDIYRHLGITDLVLFGDQRPVHRPAVQHAKRCGLRTHVFEEGYFRPHWVTLERDGVNGNSLLPRDSNWFRKTGSSLAEQTAVMPFQSPFSVRATHDVIYHVAGLANPLLYPGYRTHAPITAPVEYSGYIRQFARLRRIRQREHERVRSLIDSGSPYFVLPLQLNTDAQIREHSRFAHMGEVIEHVHTSFAQHAPKDALLVIKNHPLDTGLMNYARIIAISERRLGLEGRTVYLEDGDLVALAKQTRGMVTVNSTAGMVALEYGAPTLTLGDPIYNLPGLTAQTSLDKFWYDASPPSYELFSNFRRVVMHTTQINGGLYCRPGIRLAVENACRVLLAEKSPLERLL